MAITPRRILAIALLAWASVLLSLPSGAQPAGTTDCGNGHYCPSGSACLMDGLCAVQIDLPPGATRMSNGRWCEPGSREGTINRGFCIPDTYTECGRGACRPGTTCSSEGSCIGGPPNTGPICGGVQCPADRACNSANRCYDPSRYNDCGNGDICSKAATCQYPRGCVYVASERTRQIRIR